MVHNPSYAAPSEASSGKTITVLVTDDSAVVRGLVARWLSAEKDIEIVAKASDGELAIKAAQQYKPDVVILDIEMPRLDGLSALPQILKASPSSKVVMASTLTHRNADITLRALSKGAADYVPKPESSTLASANDFRDALIAKVRALGEVKHRRAAPARATAAPPARVNRVPAQKGPRPKAQALFIGSSTGGPQALRDVMAVLGPKLDIPIFITQHMPKAFTKVLAEHLTKASRKLVVEGRDGMPVKANGVYLAPGDYHMTVRRKGATVVIGLDQRPPENYCRPAVDPMFRSAAEIYGNKALGVVLTGMGHDGCAGAENMVKTGAAIIAQDEATSVVWGMPGSIARAGLAQSIQPLKQVAPTVLRMVSGEQVK